jgi:hypothetical protein
MPVCVCCPLCWLQAAVRLCAAQWASKLFPRSHMPSRWGVGGGEGGAKGGLPGLLHCIQHSRASLVPYRSSGY